jgi:nucleotide-binding universal stress UspA family protein
MIKKILVPLDGSKLAECALPYAEEMAEKLGAEVTLFTVTNSLQGYWPYEGYRERSARDMMQGENTIQPAMIPVGVCSMEDHASKYLETSAKSLEAKGIKVNKRVVCGKTANEILIGAKIENNDLIIMSSHGRSGPSKLIHGSVAQKVLKGSNIPVMIIRAPGCTG